METNNQQTPSFGTGAAYTNTLNTVREMKTYAINENELQSISLLNTATSGLFSFGTMILFLGIGLKTGAIIEGLLTEQAEVLVRVGFWLAIAMTVVCYILALCTWLNRRSMLKRILKETKVIS